MHSVPVGRNVCQIQMITLSAKRDAKRRRRMRALSPYEAAACNYMQRPKNAAALSRDATKGEGGFYEIEEFRPRAHLSPFPFLLLSGGP